MIIKKTSILILVMLCATAAVFAQAKPKPEHFGATAYSMQRGARMVQVDVRVKSYTDNATTQHLAGALLEGARKR